MKIVTTVFDALQYPLGGLALVTAALSSYSLKVKNRRMGVASGVAFIAAAIMLGVASIWPNLLQPFTSSAAPGSVKAEGNGNQVVIGNGNSVNSGQTVDRLRLNGN